MYHHSEDLSQLRHNLFVKFLPDVVILLFLSCLGIIGNCLAIPFFAQCKRSSTIVLIIGLAVTDLFVCLLLVPNVMEVYVNVTHNQPFFCKLAHFMSHWTVANSCVIMASIAVDRYRKICKPFGKQLQLNAAKVVVVIITVVSFLLTVRVFATADSINVDVMTHDENGTDAIIVGKFCSSIKYEPYKTVGTAFSMIEFVALIGVWVTIIVTYTNVVRTLVKMKMVLRHRSGREKKYDVTEKRGNVNVQTIVSTLEVDDGDATSQAKVEKSVDSQAHSSCEDTNVFSGASSTEDQRENGDANGPGNDHGASTKNRKRRKRKLSKRQRSITLMMLFVSMFFVVFFTPYFVLKIATINDKRREYELSTGWHLALNLPHMNSVINPIVYFVFNPEFRHYLIAKWRDVCNR